MDNFATLSNRLLGRAPAIGLPLAQQFINDAWHTLQSRQQWSWRRKSGVFSPPDLYSLGQVSTNKSTGQPFLISGTGTNWTPEMIGRQIRAGGLLFPFYTIAGYVSPTSILLDKPWAGSDLVLAAYSMLQSYYPVPDDFGFFYAVVSIKDSYRLWTNLTQAELAIMDPQRTNFGQTYAVSFKDYTPIYQGVISPAIPLGDYPSSPLSTTESGFSYPLTATYLLQISSPGITGTAGYVWTRIGTSGFSSEVATGVDPLDLSDGVQVYWPDGVNWSTGQSWIINAQPAVQTGGPRFELWPAPTFSKYLYPYEYVTRVADLTVQSPTLPPFIANRGDLLIEMGLEKCAEFPGQDSLHPNIYYNLKQAQYHRAKYLDMLVDVERDDQEIEPSNIDYQSMAMAPSPWMTGQWRQSHAPPFQG